MLQSKLKALKPYLLSLFLLAIFSIVFFQIKWIYAQESSSQPLTPPVTTPQLSISIINPLNGAIVSGIVPIEAEATSSSGISNVFFQVDGQNIASDSSYPYIVNWDTSSLVPGSFHTLMAFVQDLLGESASSSAVLVSITPDTTPTPSPSSTPSPTPTPTPTPTPIPDTTPPTVSITSPLDGAIVRKNTTVTITAEASDNDQVAKIEFFVNGVLKCTDTTQSYSCDWLVPKKANVLYTLQAKAIDYSGNTSTNTIQVKAR